jgi:UDP-N-acetylmuramyl pentapeptide phosphotransferase/UDP-N-acetylglucosamine-1-phosphate transferase
MYQQLFDLFDIQLMPPEFSGVLKSYLLTATIAFVASVFLVLTKNWHGTFSLDPSDGIQKFHRHPTPRIGGIAIVFSIVVAWVYLAEDLSKNVNATIRLSAALLSGLLGCWLTDHQISRVDVWGIDALLELGVFSVLFTMIAVAGVSNSINIIDGMNGLASFTAIFAYLGYAAIAAQIGDHHIVVISLFFAASLFGFLWVNWPMGKLFLGDGGSYFVGFTLAWIAIMLVERNSEVSAFSALLVCAYPITEVLFSIFRRSVKRLRPWQPDRLHLHSLMKQRYIRRWCHGAPRYMRNSITGVFLGVLSSIGPFVANLTYTSAAQSTLAFVIFSVGFLGLIVRIVYFKWANPLQLLIRKRKRLVAAASA